MTAKVATIEDLYHVPDHQKAEIVNGAIALMPPTGDDPGYAGDEVFVALREYSKRTRQGRAVGDNKGFRVDLPNRQSFSPDAAFHIGTPAGMKFFEGAPIFAVEVRSAGDYGDRAEAEMAAKRVDYFAAGTQVVWDVDLLSEDVVRVYRADQPKHPTIYRRGELAEAEPAVGQCLSMICLLNDCFLNSFPLSKFPMAPPIQWYPGHIAKAERALVEQLKKVDVVLEVRDARIPLATRHPQMDQWLNNKERVLVLNRVDMIPHQAQQDWTKWFKERGEQPYFANASQGKGVSNLSQATQNAGAKMNQRRHDRGMLPRPVRAVVIGFPNVGKSALINRLLNRRVVDSARRAGITRQLRWVRISDELELLDAPGVLPSKLMDQEAAVKLAICDDIGEASYDNQRVACALIDRIQQLYLEVPQMLPKEPFSSRYKVVPEAMTGESYLEAVAERKYQGDREKTARQFLNDFRKGVWGAIPLELPNL